MLWVVWTLPLFFLNFSIFSIFIVLLEVWTAFSEVQRCQHTNMALHSCVNMLTLATALQGTHKKGEWQEKEKHIWTEYVCNVHFRCGPYILTHYDDTWHSWVDNAAHTQLENQEWSWGHGRVILRPWKTPWKKGGLFFIARKEMQDHAFEGHICGGEAQRSIGGGSRTEQTQVENATANHGETE